MAGKTKKPKVKKTPPRKKSPFRKKASQAKQSPAKQSPDDSKSPNSQQKKTGIPVIQIQKHSGHSSVYIDVEFDRGLLYLVLVNGGDQPVEKVSVEFDKPLYGANGMDLSSLGIFRHLAFLPPGKTIRVFLDDTHAYYAKRQRSIVKFELSWYIDKSRFSNTISHDMRAYADFTYIIEHPDNRRLGHMRP